MPAALVLQAHDAHPPGLLGAWARGRGVAFDVIRIDRWSSLPDPSGYLFAVALGAEASLADPWPPWASNAVDWLATAHALELPVLGIGFGAQALAVALGGSVRRLSVGEPAWVTVQTRDPARVPSGPWLVPHRDAISAPAQADELARDGSGVLAFASEAHLGLNFHPEVTPALLAGWYRGRRGQAASERAALLHQAHEQRQRAALAALTLFDAFAARAGMAAPLGARPARPAAAAHPRVKRRLVFAPFSYSGSQRASTGAHAGARPAAGRTAPAAAARGPQATPIVGAG